MLSKLLENIFLKRLQLIINVKDIIPSPQFEFRANHWTTDQVHRKTNLIEDVFEKDKASSAVFLDVSQVCDKLRHQGLMYKLTVLLDGSYCNFLCLYLSHRYCKVKVEDEYSQLKSIHAGVPQGSVLVPVLYLLYTSDMPTYDLHRTATFADDTAL